MEDARFCRSCSVQLETNRNLAPNLSVAAQTKNPGLAAVLSFLFCGLGQIYNGQIGKGVGMLIIYAISIALVSLAIGLITSPVLWIWGMVDAYRTSVRINAESIAGKNLPLPSTLGVVSVTFGLVLLLATAVLLVFALSENGVLAPYIYSMF